MNKKTQDKLFIDSLLSEINDLKDENYRLKDELRYNYDKKISVKLKKILKKVIGK